MRYEKTHMEANRQVQRMYARVGQFGNHDADGACFALPALRRCVLCAVPGEVCVSSPSRYRQRKDANQAEIVKALEAIGCDVIVMHSPVDLLVGRSFRTMLLECKDGSKPPSARRLTKEQLQFHASWRGHKAVVTSPEEAIEAVLSHCRMSS